MEMQLNKSKTIAIDMDGVLANVEPQLVKVYNTIYDTSITVADIQGKTHAEAFPLDTKERRVIHTPGFFRHLEVMPGAIEVVRKLMKHFEVYVVSSAMEFPLSLDEKYDWLQAHFPFIDWRHIVFCGDKRIINTYYMIDDHCKNLDFFKGRTLLYHAHHNTEVTHHHRVKNWSEILHWFEKEMTFG